MVVVVLWQVIVVELDTYKLAGLAVAGELHCSAKDSVALNFRTSADGSPRCTFLG